MKSLLLFSIVFVSFSALAARPPLAESFRKMQAIIGSPVVYKGLSARKMSEISSISQRPDGLYELQVEDCKLLVSVESEIGSPSEMVPQLAVTIVSTEADCSAD
jgi:hypothetical protein